MFDRMGFGQTKNPTDLGVFRLYPLVLYNQTFFYAFLPCGKVWESGDRDQPSGNIELAGIESEFQP